MTLPIDLEELPKIRQGEHVRSEGEGHCQNIEKHNVYPGRDSKGTNDTMEKADGKP